MRYVSTLIALLVAAPVSLTLANPQFGGGHGIMAGSFGFGISGQLSTRGAGAPPPGPASQTVTQSLSVTHTGTPAADLRAVEVERIGDRLRVRVPWNVLFDFDRHDLRPAAEATLKAISTLAHSRRATRIQLLGHADAIGSTAYNERLSQRRADAVKRWLVSHGGFTSGAIDSLGYGESRPIAPNTHPNGADNPYGRALNRRVEFII